MYNSFVLAHYHSSALFQEYYRLHWSLAGNALAHVLLAALLLPFSPLLAQRIPLTRYCVSLPFAFRYAVRAWKPSEDAIAFAGFLLIYNMFLNFGFWNFCFSMALFLIAFGYLLCHAARLNWRTGSLMTC